MSILKDLLGGGFLDKKQRPASWLNIVQEAGERGATGADVGAHAGQNPMDNLPPLGTPPPVAGVEALTPKPLLELPPLGSPVDANPANLPPLNLPASPPRPELPPLGEAAPNYQPPPVDNLPPLTESSIPVAGVEALTPKPLIDLPPLGTAQTMPDLPPLTQSQTIQNRINKRNEKDYSIRTDENGNIVRGKDRDTNSTWLDKLKNVGLGAVEGLATGGLAGAIGGSIAGGLDRDYASKFGDRRQLAQDLPKLQQAQEAENFQLGQETRRIANRNIEADNARADETLALRKATSERNSLLGQVRKMTRYKRGENPAFDAKLEAANIEQPDFEKDKKLYPRFYDSNGQMKTFNANGGVEPVLEGGQPIIDETKATIYVNGYAVKGRDALSAETAAGVKNNQYANSDDEDLTKWRNDTNEINAFNGSIDAKIQSQRQTAQNLELANQELEARKASLNANPLLNADAIKQLDQQINSNTNAWRTANAEITTLGGQKKTLPIKPAPRQRVSTPTVSKGNATFTESQAHSYYESQGKSKTEIDALIQKGKAQKIIN